MPVGSCIIWARCGRFWRHDIDMTPCDVRSKGPLPDVIQTYQSPPRQVLLWGHHKLSGNPQSENDLVAAILVDGVSATAADS